MFLDFRVSLEGFKVSAIDTETNDSRTIDHDPNRDRDPLAERVWRAWKTKGSRYVWHKAMRRGLARWPALKRKIVYADPRAYWTIRGGDDYFLEQEGQPARTARAHWIADRIAEYRPDSILEIGCGYGKQIRALRDRIPVPIVGIDFSPSQLEFARDYLHGYEDIHLFLGSGDRLPFADRSFDLVLTSAVILHNPPAIAERIRLEVVRVSRRFAAHNEDLDQTYNRYGYDTAAWYRDRGARVLEAGPFPAACSAEASVPTQFCVAEPWRSH